MTRDTLFYDGACPLCRAEIRRLHRHAGNRIDLVDIHQLDDFTGLPSKRDLLARLHLLSADGQWLTGLDANIRAWRQTPYRRLWEALGWPVIRVFTHRAYDLWLLWRTRNRNIACEPCTRRHGT